MPAAQQPRPQTRSEPEPPPEPDEPRLPSEDVASAGNAEPHPSINPANLSFRPLTRSDEADALALVKLALGGLSLESWHWKHDGSPFGSSYALCAEDASRSRLAAIRMLMRWNLVDAHGTALPAARPVDTATHPDFRRRGIFSALTRHAVEALQHEGIGLLFNTPNDNSLPGYLKLGWTEVARWQVHVRPLHPLRSLHRLSIRRSTSPAPPAAPTPEAAELTSWTRFRENGAANLDALIAAHEAGRRRLGYRTVRNTAYLDWRYGGHPHMKYGVFTSAAAGALDGLVIARAARGRWGLRALVITELFTRNPSNRTAARLLRRFIHSADADYLIAHFTPRSIEGQALRRLGFLPAPRRSYTLVARGLGALPLDPGLRGSWDLTLGDLELF